MNVLYVFPGSNFGQLENFKKNSEVRIGYGLAEDISKLDEIKRRKIIEKYILKRKSKLSDSGVKAKVTWINAFFDAKLKYGIIPTKDFQSFLVVKLSPDVTFVNDPKVQLMQIRKFEFIKELPNYEHKKNKKGVSKTKSENIKGLDDIINNYETKFPSKSISEGIDDQELQVFEGAIKVQLRLHKKKERDVKFRKDYRERHRSIVDCPACSFNAKDIYGIDNPNSILEMHHIVPLKFVKEEMVIKEKDVSFLCPNCHRAIHKLMSLNQIKTISIKEFKKCIK